MQDQLKVLAAWLKDYGDTSFDCYTEGVLEAQLRQNHDKTMRQIGDYLEEILQMNEKQLQDNLE